MKKQQSAFKDIDDFLKWKEEWVGMPEFTQEDLAPHHSILVSFKNENEMSYFSELVEQKITNRTKSIWYPKVERENLLNKMCI